MRINTPISRIPIKKGFKLIHWSRDQVAIASKAGFVWLVLSNKESIIPLFFINLKYKLFSYLSYGETLYLRKVIEHQRKVFYSVPQPDLIKERFEESV